MVNDCSDQVENTSYEESRIVQSVAFEHCNDMHKRLSSRNWIPALFSGTGQSWRLKSLNDMLHYWYVGGEER